MKRCRIAAIALAAGLSRRMGLADKLLLDFAGRPLFSYTLERIAAADVEERIAVTNCQVIAARAAANGFLVRANTDSRSGVSTSLRAGILAAGDDVDGYMFFTCDQPLLSAAVVETLLAAFRKSGRIVVPRVGSEGFSPCIFPVHFRAELLALTGDTGGRAVYRRHKEEVAWVDFTSATDFQDVDTAAEYDLLQRLQDR